MRSNLLQKSHCLCFPPYPTPRERGKIERVVVLAGGRTGPRRKKRPSRRAFGERHPSLELAVWAVRPKGLPCRNPGPRIRQEEARWL
jgi:hypothetical protein